jgi:hypothetical protein
LSRTESSSSKDRGGGRSGGSSRLVVDLSRVSVEDDEEDPAWLMKKSVLVEDIERSLSIGQLGASKVYAPCPNPLVDVLNSAWMKLS